MSQANLQCEYWCPCVGASNERTSALIQGRVPYISLSTLFFFFSLNNPTGRYMRLISEKIKVVINDRRRDMSITDVIFPDVSI